MRDSDSPMTSPAYALLPGTIVQSDSVIFSAVFHDAAECGLILYRLSDAKLFRIPFTDEFRFGDLCSVSVRGIKPSEWGYRYYRDDFTFLDPYVREIRKLKTKEGEIEVGMLFPRDETVLPACRSRKLSPWQDKVICCLHVKGYTASRTSGVTGRGARGTYAGLTQKIPYLKELGITAVELLPIYELRPPVRRKPRTASAAAAAAAETVTKSSAAAPGETKEKTNYWGFGEGYYCAPKRSFSSTGDPQKEFADMVCAFHDAGIEVYLQLYFPDHVPPQTRHDVARFYATRYCIDGFHLKGSDAGLSAIANDPLLADRAILYYDFPYQELHRESPEYPEAGRPSVAHLASFNDSYRDLLRRFVKGDDETLRDFIREFISVSEDHGRVRYVTNYEGFTLADLVSYNWKHNEANGEENRDGADRNLSWNCGVEGKSRKKEITALRLRQMRNFLALTVLAQGTPMLLAGDEFLNSQDGNNNPWCQDNETGYVNWHKSADALKMQEFTKQLLALRQSHAALRRSKTFAFGSGQDAALPEISFHGKEAWKPDFGSRSHCAGILLREDQGEAPSYLFVAVNMYWQREELGLPMLPQGYVWRTVMDTFLPEPFPAEPAPLTQQQHVLVRERSVQVLTAGKEA